MHDGNDECGGRRPAGSDAEWLDRLVTGGVRSLGLIDNTMYAALAEDSLTDEEFAHFLRAYRRLLDRAHETADRRELPGIVRVWYREYVKAVISQADAPTPASRGTAEYLRSLTFTRPPQGDHPPAARDHRLGAEPGWGHAIGYALAGEVIADFQLALITLAVLRRYPRPAAEETLSAVLGRSAAAGHRDPMTCDAIEALLDAGRVGHQDVEAGFVQAVVDSRDAMLALHRVLTQRPAAERPR